MLLFTGVVSRCEDQFLKIAKLKDTSTLVPDIWSGGISVAGLYCAGPLPSTAVPWFKRLPVDVLYSAQEKIPW